MAERFFLDHGMIHDRASGKHVTTDDTLQRGGTAEALDLLNELAVIDIKFAAEPTTRQLAWALCRLDIESRPRYYGLQGLFDFCSRPDAEIDAIASERAFMFEAQANHIRHWLTKVPSDD
jgi:hypothetical protein